MSNSLFLNLNAISRKPSAKKMTTLEARVWNTLRGKRFVQYKFRRQFPVGPYIADFICLEARLIVEADGPHHLRGDQIEYDATRDAYLKEQGFRVLRLSGGKIVGDLAVALQRVPAALRNDSLENNPS